MSLVDYESMSGIETPETLNEVISLLEADRGRMSPMDGLGTTWLNRVWRGQAKQWPLHSSAVRRLMESGRSLEFLEDERLKEYEDDLIYLAEQEGHHLRDGRRLSELEMLAKLQHNGAATRLVDFTDSFFVALWFACKDHKSHTGVIFGVPDVGVVSWKGAKRRNKIRKISEGCRYDITPRKTA